MSVSDLNQSTTTLGVEDVSKLSIKGSTSGIARMFTASVGNITIGIVASPETFRLIAGLLVRTADMQDLENGEIMG